MKRALITGGGSGIGRTLAERFHDNGYAVTICGRKLAPLEDTAKGRDIRCYQADVTSESDIEALFDAPYDIVVANAGGSGAGKLASLSLEEWNTTLAVNLTEPFSPFAKRCATCRSDAPDCHCINRFAEGKRLCACLYSRKTWCLGPRALDCSGDGKDRWNLQCDLPSLPRLRSRKMPLWALWNDLISAATPHWTRSQLVIRNGV